MFNERASYTAADIRFTTKDSALYAMTLGRPQTSTITLASLKDGDVARIEVVGTAAPLPFKQDGNGLTVTLPSGASHEFGVALKIMGTGVV